MQFELHLPTDIKQVLKSRPLGRCIRPTTGREMHSSNQSKGVWTNVFDALTDAHVARSSGLQPDPPHRLRPLASFAVLRERRTRHDNGSDNISEISDLC
jgi:hypothetical protein